MTVAAASNYRLSAAERERLARDGYLVREAVFDAAEVRAIGDCCEALVDSLVRGRDAPRQRFGSYVFDVDAARGVVLKWEGDTDVVHGIEPFAHLSPEIHAWAHDPRFIEPMRDIVGDAAPMLFTEKLNLKRPVRGGENPLHQDYPYWVPVAEAAEDVATAMLFLDEATLANGCLHVVPGSHLRGPWRTRTDGDAFAGNEIDAGAYPDVEPVPVEARPGTVILFGAMLVHRSGPNTSSAQRRALLFSYQPHGRPTQLDALRRRYPG